MKTLYSIFNLAEKSCLNLARVEAQQRCDIKPPDSLVNQTAFITYFKNAI